MLLHNINETQLKVANNVVGIPFKPVTYDSEHVEIHRTRFVRQQYTQYNDTFRKSITCIIHQNPTFGIPAVRHSGPERYAFLRSGGSLCIPASGIPAPTPIHRYCIITIGLFYLSNHSSIDVQVRQMFFADDGRVFVLREINLDISEIQIVIPVITNKR